MDFYDAKLIANQPNISTVTGSKTDDEKPLSPVRVFMDSIDMKVTGRGKEQLCSVNRPYPVVPGKHVLLVVISAGEPFASSRVGSGQIQIDVPSNARLTIKGEALSSRSGTIWVEDAKGNIVSDRVDVLLKDSPSKGMPAGFAVIESSCWLP
ncbi:hypothetical protein [Herbaspirillum chlorophenolicum]|uniref:hypothetical protein n=1 Tax=Herbaspirillum chlorophenolicum TaxID=211589 RepID=UPI0012E285E0|nr:hypothetical protein [Herbaspirillum chlorophenolicum]